MSDPVTHSRPFLVDYTHEGRPFSFLLLGPGSWPEAEAHLASIKAGAIVTGSDVVEIPVDEQLGRMLAQWAGEAEALLSAHVAAGKPVEVALTGAAVLSASCLVAGLSLEAANATALEVMTAAYRMPQA
jgi:hypothetical protein